MRPELRDRRRGGLTQIELLAVIAVIGTLAALLLPAVQSARESSRRAHCVERMRGIGQAMQQYEGVHRTFPPGLAFRHSVYSDTPFNDYPSYWLSPHALLLAYLDDQILFEALPTRPPGSLDGHLYANLYLEAQLRLPTFLCPSDPTDFGNNYRVCMGGGAASIESPTGGGAFASFLGIKAAEIRDGMSQTVALSEAMKSDADLANYSSADYWFSGARGLGRRRTTDEMIAICGALSATPPPGGFYSYVGHTWGVAGYDFTWYNHAVGPNSSVPDCTSNHPIWQPGGAVYNESFFGIHKASSHHPGGVNLAYLDGSVKFANDAIDLNLWRALASIAGREVGGQ